VEGISILDEISGDLGLLLWRSARNVTLWAETPAEQRATLFPGDAARSRTADLARADVHPELRGPLSVLTALLARPGEVDLLRLVNACRRIAAWAEQRGDLATALEFSQAAALAAPESASLAYAVGRLARRRAEYDRAESWYTRAVVQGRQSSDWRSYALAFSGMGNLHMQRGNYPAARRAHLRSLRVAERRGMVQMVGIAYHDLFAIDTEMHVGFEADVLAERAFIAYGPNDPRVKRLAYDVAYHWVLLGYCKGAARVAEALLPHFEDPAERVALLGLIGRSAGGLCDRDRFESALDEARVLLLRASTAEVASLTLLGFAHGAASLGDASLTTELAKRVTTLANRRSEWRVAMEAEAVAESAVTRRGVAAQVPASGEPLHGLANVFVDALSIRAVPVAA
jgi:tetratricopeptide (TPR) repeat protein